jgi:hypothetical protein
MEITKRIKNEQWSIKELISKINNKEISKPQFQRKKKWDILPKNSNIPDERSYIVFLYNTCNSVHAITFGQENTGQYMKFSNIDGNNRINTIKHFIDCPFHIFSEYLNDLYKFIKTLEIEELDKDLLKQIFSKLTYNEIIYFRYHKYFNENRYDILYKKIKIYREEFDQIIEDIQKRLKINGIDNFDSTVKINVNLFEGYNIDELCKIFEDINKYDSKLTDTELLACSLFNETNFIISDKIIKSKIEECIEEYYIEKSNDEALTCYKYNSTNDIINAHDFIIGFQNYCNKIYNFIDKSTIDGLSLYFKLYKILYDGYSDKKTNKTHFTTENITNFTKKIIDSCEILNKTINNIFSNKIKLFNNSCQEKLNKLKKNNLCLLFCTIIGFKNNKTPENIIIHNIEKCLLYHFMLNDLKNNDLKKGFKSDDSITYIAGGTHIEHLSNQLLINPELISNKIEKQTFSKLISDLYNEINNPYKRKLENGKNKNNNRRNINFYEKVLMIYYYKNKIPVNMLNNDFSIEHICPNSSEWVGELDKDRTGNLIPIIDTINSSRGNRHINEYKKNKNGIIFCTFIKDIIPNDELYDSIILHTKNQVPNIIDIDKYNKMCENNEQIYKDNFISILFS